MNSQTRATIASISSCFVGWCGNWFFYSFPQKNESISPSFVISCILSLGFIVLTIFVLNCRTPSDDLEILAGEFFSNDDKLSELKTRIEEIGSEIAQSDDISGLPEYFETLRDFDQLTKDLRKPKGAKS